MAISPNRSPPIPLALRLSLPFLLSLSLLLPVLPPASARRARTSGPCQRLNAKLLKAPFDAYGYSYVSPSDVTPCSRALFPFNATIALSDLDATIYYLKYLYPIVHIAKASPDPNIPSSYDVVAELTKLAEVDWKYMDDFYVALSKTVDRLNDGHTVAYLVTSIPYVFLFPLPLVGVVENGQPVIRVAPVNLTYDIVNSAVAQPPFNLNTSAFFGSRVVSIAGELAWDYMQAWAQNYSGVFHNAGQQLNNAFARFRFSFSLPSFSVGSFSIRSYSPDQDFLRLELQRPGQSSSEVINVPWVVALRAYGFPYRAPHGAASALTSPPRTPTSGVFRSHLQQHRSLMGALSTSKPHFRSTLEDMRSGPQAFGSFQASENEAAGFPQALSRFRHQRRLQGWMRHHRGLKASSGASEGLFGPDIYMVPASRVPVGFDRWESVGPRGSSLASTPDATLISAVDDLWPVYQLGDGKTAVVVISSFAYPPTYYNPDFVFLTGTIDAFAKASKCCSRIIIDFSGNGGGSVAYAQWLVQLLAGSKALNKAGSLQQDNIQMLGETQLVRDLIHYNITYWDWKDFITVAGKPFKRKRDFFFPLLQEAFGPAGEEGNYSTPFKLAFPNVPDIGGHGFGKKPFFGKKPVLLLSDGFCFSACQLAANILKSKFGFPIATIGGIPDSPMAFMAGGGGFVTSSASYAVYQPLQQLEYYDIDILNRTYAPPPFYLTDLAFKVAMGYLNKADPTPVEFTYAAPDYRVYHTAASIQDYTKIYADVAKFFD